MKTSIVFLFVVLSCCSGLADEQRKEWLRNESEAWLAKRRDLIEKAKENPDDQNLINLSKILRDGVNRFGQSEEAELHYIQAKYIMLTIPGHARLFADRLFDARRKTEKPWLDNNYQMIYQEAFETLRHLPSPETIKVLGSMLESEEDLWSRDEIVAIWREKSRHGAYGAVMPSPSGFALGVLQEIGLRNYPEYKSHASREVPLTWWRQVKTGQRAFSFKGQAVEYRFKPDGTWDTIPIANPPDDGPKPAATTTSERPAKRPSPALQVAQETSRDAAWWYTVFACVFLALSAWFWKKRTV